MKNSIGTKLFIAFGIAMFLALIAPVVGWLSFDEIARRQQSVVEKAIPTMRQVQAISELATKIVAAEPRLANATYESQRQVAYNSIDSEIGKLEELILNIDHQEFDPRKISRLDTVVESISSNFRQQNLLMTVRLDDETRFMNSTRGAQDDIEALTDIAVSLVANSASTATAVTSNLYDLIDTDASRDTVFDVLDRLVEVDIDSLERMFELQQKDYRLSSQIGSLGLEVDLREIDIDRIEKEYLNTIEVLNRRLVDINDPGRKTQAAALLTRLSDIAELRSDSNVFRLRRNILRRSNAVEQLSTNNAVLAAQLNSIVGELISEGSRRINSAATAAENAVRKGRDLSIIAAVVAALITGLILWFYIQRNVAMRLGRLQTATLQLTGGNYDVAIGDLNSDEIGTMARALDTFKGNAIEKQRLEEQLAEHRQNLEKLISERTVQLQITNQRLEDEVANHALARHRAEQASRAKTAFLATMSHELRTPLNGIIGTTALLQDTSTNGEQKDYLDVIRSAGQSLLHILNDILGYSQMEAGKLRLETIPFEPVSVIEDMLALMKPAAREKGLELQYDHNDLAGRLYVGDPGKLHQILLNLIGNAIKFTDKGTIHLTVHSQPCKESALEKLEFTISDTGIGIDPEAADLMFDAFTQADSSTTRQTGGIGLGLAICRQLVTAMGGQITLRPNPGGGAKVLFSVQLRKSSAPSPRQNRETVEFGIAAGLNILVVEDDTINQMVVRSLLERAGHWVTVVSSANLALAEVQKNLFDLILLDIGLPGMDGVDVCKKIRLSSDPDRAATPIIAISAHVFPDEIEQFLGSGMDGFVSKPINRGHLFETISSVLAGQPMSPPPAPGQTPCPGAIDYAFLSNEAGVFGRQKFHDLFNLFKRQTGGYLSRIELARVEGDRDELAAAVHGLKGAAANFGLCELINVCDQLELGARATSVSDQNVLVDDIRALVERSTALVDNWFRDADAGKFQLDDAVNM